jgi:hypothetical protein
VTVLEFPKKTTPEELVEWKFKDGTPMPENAPRAIWACHCGNDRFMVSPEGFYCLLCQTWQTGF